VEYIEVQKATFRNNGARSPLKSSCHVSLAAAVNALRLARVGVIVPWNFPIQLSISPLVGIFAAGNRAMVKMSENSQRLAELLIETTPKYFAADKLAFFADGGGRGPAFSSLPFDHLMFTGSGATGRAVMANAARNLVARSTLPQPPYSRWPKRLTDFMIKMRS
jgi:acyl-CoA reductase-like NAD-dependent aldehyde dehydrogenase